MKKILFIFLSFLTVAMLAQSTSPRFGTTPNKDNSFRMMNNTLATVTDAAGADSVTLITKAFNAVVKVALVDSLTFKSPTVSGAYLADNLTLIISGTSGKFLKFTGSNWASAGTVTLSSGAVAVIRFVFNGTKWVEASRVVQ